jgi:cell wall-associated NlpC family hydrolase
MRNRRQLPFVLAGLAFVVCSAVVPHVAEAAEPPRTFLDGREISFDVPPEIVSGTTIVPVRGILTPFDATFQWYQSTHTAVVTRGSTTVELTVGSKTAKVNGVPKPLTQPVQLIQGRTMVPLRFVAETFGFAVNWDPATRSIYVSDDGTMQLSDRSGGSRSVAARAVSIAQSLIGKPYVMGGTGPNAFDCSGFVQYVAKQVGVSLPRTSYEQYIVGIPVTLDNVQPGDLVFFNTAGDGASHVGIYVGNDTFVHAENERRGVATTELSRDWWRVRFLGARRIFR